MNTQQARALIGETFPQTFGRERFRYFAVNLLNHIDQTKAQAWNTTYIKDAFKPHVHKFERLGTYTSPDKEKLDVLIVHLTTESKLGRARTAIRNFVADYLKTRDNKDAALVAFVSPTEKQWRFSYVKMEYAAVEKENSKVGVQTTLTPARRMSYLVGEGESCHTAQSRFIDLLQDTENHPTLAQIETAFSVEAVTTEFFEQYKALFLDLKDELDNLAKKDKTIAAEFAAKKISTANFAKKLMGQIVFLYFLQKKGWLGVPKGGDWGDGPHNFLRQLFDGRFGGHKNFFNDILEPLFYDTLATDRSHEKDFCTIFKCRIPFLNGGLFEPLRDYDWEKTDIIVPNEIFSNNKRTKDDIGTGILDVFDRYNFTVNEAEPLEKEVAIDPEMLGKVFENLLGVQERKSKGSFYTPREIVHYMCQESLINYLDTALNTDNEIVPRKDIETFIYLGEQISHYEAVDAKYPIKMPVTIKKYARLIDEKLATITVCDPAIGSGAFPVGMMQEIVRARSSLTNYLDVHERTAYHFKRHAIQNCLYGVDIDSGAVEIAKLRLWLSLVVDEEDVQQIKPLPNLDYKIVAGNSLIGFPFKYPRIQQIEKLKADYFDETDHDKKKRLKHEIDAELSQAFASSKRSLGYEVTFDFEICFSEVFHCKNKFDIVIGNPPWGSKLTPEDKTALKAAFPLIDSSTPNSFAYFIGLAYRIAQADFSYVLPDSLLMKDFARTRKLITPHLSEIHWFQNIGVPDAMRPFLNVEHDVCAVIARSSHSSSLLCSTTFYDSGLKDMVCERWSASKNELIFAEFDYVFNLMLRKQDLSILKKINAFPRIDSYVQCHEGIHTGNARDILFKERKENNSCKPLFYGGGAGDVICNFVSRRAGWFVDYRQEIVDKKKGYYASLRDERIFTRPKILLTRTGNPFKAFLDEDSYASNNFFSLQLTDYEKNGTEPLKVILPFILSPLAQYFIRRFAAPRIGNTFVETKIVHLLKFRIPEIDSAVRARLLSLVEKIISEKSDEPTTDTSQTERQINQLVYALYGLTQEEIALIEAAR